MDPENTNQHPQATPVEAAPTPATPPVAKPVKKFNPLLLVLIGGGVVLILFAIIGVIVGLSLLRNPAPVQVTPTPTPVVSEMPIDVLPNPNPKYASDSAFLQIRDQLKALNQEISTANFFEPEISSPNIDLNIEIKE